GDLHWDGPLSVVSCPWWGALLTTDHGRLIRKSGEVVGRAGLDDADAVALGDGALARGDDAGAGLEPGRDDDGAAGRRAEVDGLARGDEGAALLADDVDARPPLVADDGAE